MAKTVDTGWQNVTPGACLECGFDDEWSCDGRGNVLCSCQACPYCNELSAYNFHNEGCPALLTDEEIEDALKENLAFSLSN